MNPRGLRFRLGLGLSLIFVGVALWLLPWMAGVARTSAEQAHQELNRDVARAVVENSNLYEDGQLNQKALQGVFMKLMAVNPTLEYRLNYKDLYLPRHTYRPLSSYLYLLTTSSSKKVLTLQPSMGTLSYSHLTT